MQTAEKLFVAIPLEDEKDVVAVIQKQQQAALDLSAQTGKHYEVIDYIEASLFVIHPIASVAKALLSMAEADVVAFLPGWDKSKSCKVLRLCADGYGKRTVELIEG